LDVPLGLVEVAGPRVHGAERPPHRGGVELLEPLGVGHRSTFVSTSACFYTTQGPVRWQRAVEVGDVQGLGWGRGAAAGAGGAHQDAAAAAGVGGQGRGGLAAVAGGPRGRGGAGPGGGRGPVGGGGEAGGG